MASPFGVSLKTAQRDKEADAAKVDRSKASVYSWDDDRLQNTAVVKRRITKAAIAVQRFIRACLSHWRYYNSYRIPLQQELDDIKRRRQEELDEVKDFLKRGYDQAKFEIEAEVSMPQAQFLKLRATTNELKTQIKAEEELTRELDKQILEEHNTEKRLGREKHELEAQEELSRLDKEIPLLEAERMEYEGVADEFGDIVKGLQGQLDEMNTGVRVEKAHKSCLLKYFAKILKELESRGAKPKVVQSVKLVIKYKGEPPPKPAPAPAPAPEPPNPTKAEEETPPEKRSSNGDAGPTAKDTSDLPPPKSTARQRGSALRATTGSMPAVRIEQPQSSGKSRSKSPKKEKSKEKSKKSRSKSPNRSKSPSKDRSKSPSRDKTRRGRRKSRKSVSLKSTETLDNQERDRRHQLVRQMSRRPTRSLSPLSLKEKKKNIESKNFKRSQSEEPSFNWSTMTALIDKERDKIKKEKDKKGKKKDKDLSSSKKSKRG
ncbi:expressed unknown protein [Seminavis robusta]|uniref:Uncharacterized protein n=1 Tax=Seminavis robusta TaxID=568900 RepID=A0A9N8DUN0_9STRA|nr:expressed unknown protein [Seminavis robusta]|eukprot:Sro355_g125020.1 n/a (488) ;mRNA; f:22349-23812